MHINSISSSDFDRDVERAKRSAEAGPILITDRGRPTHVLLTMAEYRRLAGRKTMAELLWLPDADLPDITATATGDEVRAAEFD
ncbi:type II toxin-antitoxin system prevent-host-death family antitoxin [Tahibacter soli]|jgi:prevent-host-death family protein|uniref:Type II toxin-antitoxin system prevent-host-death family antitoxin n=1 Tax=Tahibacter soli TaxID=2983605 RepID=A0A9X3YH91_9GAMM|nr:type II toxin-antitoxin system prevent-host-death family antitoxin [Tahibacter soli]MDC8011000.1 type II toxin-antitoxin system prevent-host-death family antitoxin [Tahibacter soli]